MARPYLVPPGFGFRLQIVVFCGVVSIRGQANAESAPGDVRSKTFKRLTLAPGESRQVQFTLDESNVRYWNTALRGWVIDPGTFDVWIGNSALANQGTTFTVGGAPRSARW